ncbi:MAG: methyltransferase [Sedimentisphaerales bacterium]
MGLINKLVEFLVGRSKKEHSVLLRMVATLIGAAVFMAGIPAIVFWVGRGSAETLLLPNNASKIISIVCFVFGIPWMLSAVFWQLICGKGTPVPVVPTKQFLQNGPYRYVRNLMILGFFLYLLGWTFLFNNSGAFLTVAVIISFLLLELKLIEEPELEKRFGDAYREYKKEIPFMLPRWKKL